MDRESIDKETLDCLIFDAIQEKINKGIAFTAYDITLTLREANPNLSIEHRDVRQNVHDIYEDGEMNGYKRQQRNMNGRMVWEYSK